MQLFYSPFADGNIVTLDEEESRHAVAVLRKKAGDEILITDGKGHLDLCKITETGKRSCKAEIVKRVDEQAGEITLHLAVAPTKNNERFDWFLEKGTELGITEFSPIICSRSERTVLKTKRAKKILVAAMKQSGRLHLPQINEPVAFSTFIKEQRGGFNAIACMDARELLQKLYRPQMPATLLIGPEGDFAEEEISLAVDAGYKKVSLGNRRLRTETAALAACMAINMLNNL